jgi:hypothetical protein
VTARSEPATQSPALEQHRVRRGQHAGEVAEWPNAPVLKTGVPQGTVGSNPTLSAQTKSL